jgi:predicted metallopeptidase
LNCALPILAESDTREALALAVIAPSSVVAIILAGSHSTVIARVFSIANTFHVFTGSAAVTIIWALLNGAI